MKKYIYPVITVVCGALNANMICLPSHNMATDVIGIFSLMGATIFMTLCGCAIDEEAYDKAMHEYIYKTTRDISILRAKNKILEECLRERKEDENDECK